MTDKIEFEATPWFGRLLKDEWGISSRKMIEIPRDVKGGIPYVVTMTQVEPEQVPSKPPEPELNPRPRCGGKVHVIPAEFGGGSAMCEDCHEHSSWRKSYKGVIEAHNARKSPELDPCPHCGGEWQEYFRPVSEVYFAECTGCHFKTSVYSTQWDLAAAINRRA